MVKLYTRSESWPIRGTFRISRGSKNSADVVVCELEEDEHLARGECTPYARYGETIASVLEQIDSLSSAVAAGLDRIALQEALPPGAARNALDCALWDLQAKRSGQRVWQLAGLPEPRSLTTVYTLSMDAPDAMRQAALEHADKSVLKLKLGDDTDLERVRAVREGAPGSTIVVDANEGWSPQDYERIVPELVSLGVAMIEQPFPSEADQALSHLDRPIPVCADESCHDTASLEVLAGKYDIANIKLDKTGGLTQALAVREAATAAGFEIMVGCMVGTSLAMAPGTLVGQGARIVDLDGPLLLARDRDSGLLYDGARVEPPERTLWG